MFLDENAFALALTAAHRPCVNFINHMGTHPSGVEQFFLSAKTAFNLLHEYCLRYHHLKVEVIDDDEDRGFPDGHASYLWVANLKSFPSSDPLVKIVLKKNPQIPERFARLIPEWQRTPDSVLLMPEYHLVRSLVHELGHFHLSRNLTENVPAHYEGYVPESASPRQDALAWLFASFFLGGIHAERVFRHRSNEESDLGVLFL